MDAFPRHPIPPGTSISTKTNWPAKACVRTGSSFTSNSGTSKSSKADIATCFAKQLKIEPHFNDIRNVDEEAMVARVAALNEHRRCCTDGLPSRNR